MRHSFEKSSLRAGLSLVATLLMVAACDGPKAPETTSGAPATATATASPAPSIGASAATAVAMPSATSSQAPAGSPALGGRTGELVNPDAATMVFLYYDLAGIPPPIDSWVEEDTRVKYITAIDKAAKRVEVKAELESGIASVRGVGSLRLSLGANLSDYDPSYGEFTVRALAPSSVIEFPALGQKVSVKFANGRTAQIWKMSPADAQQIRDKIGSSGYAGSVSMDVALRITGVQPAPGGGTITTEVLEYELREDRSGAKLGRVELAQ